MPPIEAFAYPGMRDFLEYSLFMGWMDQYLTYPRCRCLLELKPDLRLDDFLDVPMYIRTWFEPAVDLETFRFGIIFRIYDWCVDVMKSPPLTIEKDATAKVREGRDPETTPN
ncbi:hypothetical protein COLO4_00533 [Corchorus olitorius]|uniref:Uncharacterized protein n=1 Tax=Corchorus olitorius TaxID=93759 RepID=A0A1R3L3V8_9ROSI|nr:hypothetical protein COLO4_00533 [Corchorus olitorius]